MAEHNGSADQERTLQQRNQTSLERRGQVQYYGDREWHRGVDMYGNPVWYRAYGWSWTAGREPGSREEEPHAHGRTQSRHYQRSDERIREDVYDRLNDHPNVDSSDIRVSVSGGEVTLEGTVHGRREKRMAEDIAESVSGVRDVQNRLRLADQTPAASTAGSEATPVRT
jgi:osmotically-inducible protein OsmY